MGWSLLCGCGSVQVVRETYDNPKLRICNRHPNTTLAHLGVYQNGVLLYQ